MSTQQPIKSSVNVEKYFSNEFKNLIKNVDKTINEFPVSEVTVEYFLMVGLGNEDTMLYKALNGFLNSLSIEKIYDSIYDKIQDTFLSTIKPGRQIELTSDLRNLFNKSNEERMKMGNSTITSDHFLLAILNPNNIYKDISIFFQNENMNYDKYLQLASDLHNVTDSLNKMPENTGIQVNVIGNPANMGNFDINKMIGNIVGGNPMQQQGKKKSISNYCTNLNDLAEQGKIDDIVGRKREIEQITHILARRKSNNVVIVGESGVGKTAIVEGLAKLIQQGTSPKSLKDKIIYRFNIPDMMGGTQFRGIFEDRMTSLIKELKQNKNSILFIDNFHNFVKDKQNNEFDIPTFLTSILNDGDVNVIITTTYKGYHSCFTSNADLQRYFQRIDVDETTINETIDILHENKVYYAGFHKVIYTDEAIDGCVKLSKRYITDRKLPSSAIDILDEAGASKKLECYGDNSELTSLKETLSFLKKDKDEAIKNDDIEKSETIQREIDGTKSKIAYLEDILQNTVKNNTVTIDDVYKTISLHTNIPVGKLNVSDRKTVTNIDSILKKVIVGQDDAINAVSNAIKRSKVGLYPTNRPIFSCMCIGNTGCGKTLLAKSLAKEIFGDEKYLVRFDMSEYSDKTSVNKLIGSSAGYIGYDRGGLLTEAVKNKKHAVLLIDEIEKSTDEVFNLFLQIFDEGFLTDNTGQKVDFKNTIIILTSNVGAKEASMEKAIGFNVDSNLNKKSIIEKELKKKFPPEFINRLDDVVYFNNLTNDNLKDIIRLELNKLVKRLNNINFDMKYADSAVEYIFNMVKKEKEYGARPILRAIQVEIENKIADIILKLNYNEHIFMVSANDNKLNII